ncbi:MAG: hypothetical protein KIG95_03905 [Comamonas sp.]|nr:hypothetical protein [Comamonas sp.]
MRNDHPRHRLHQRRPARPSAHVRVRVEHINAAWQLDASRCVLWKTPKGELLLLQEGVHYKNKPEQLLAVMDKVVTRFVCVDVASHAIATRSYSGGESAENALDAGNARATGSVEVAQNIVERGMESRLRFLDPASITMARLNALGELWMHAYNGSKKHSRHDMTRYAAWSTIATEHLRTAPGSDARAAHQPGANPHRQRRQARELCY